MVCSLYPSPLPPLYQCFVFRVFKASQSLTQKGEKLKQGCDVTGDQTRDLTHQRPHPNQQCAILAPVHLGFFVKFCTLIF